MADKKKKKKKKGEDISWLYKILRQVRADQIAGSTGGTLSTQEKQIQALEKEK
jgi:hypothetical protein